MMHVNEQRPGENLQNTLSTLTILFCGSGYHLGALKIGVGQKYP
jgi:hypothetical protein